MPLAFSRTGPPNGQPEAPEANTANYASAFAERGITGVLETAGKAPSWMSKTANVLTNPQVVQALDYALSGMPSAGVEAPWLMRMIAGWGVPTFRSHSRSMVPRVAQVARGARRRPDPDSHKAARERKTNPQPILSRWGPTPVQAHLKGQACWSSVGAPNASGRWPAEIAEIAPRPLAGPLVPIRK
jgi:hypothetical protein